MPRLENKGKRGASSGVLEADLRLTDFAHAALPSAGSSRVSKKVVNASAKTIRETRHWWECEEEDFFDDLTTTGAGNQSDEEEEVQITAVDDCDENVSTGRRNRRKPLSAFTSDGQDLTVDAYRYPIDLWFLISDYIRPEDVGRFALICRRSYQVTRSSRFWRQLYRRFYDPRAINVPEPFRPLALQRPYGLRTRVIKALYCSYGKFLERSRVSSGVSLSTDAVAKLYRGTCESTWWDQHQDSGKTVWRFYFKFHGRQIRTTSISRSAQMANARSRPVGNASLDYLDDTWANLEDGCCVLKVTCHQYTQVPTVLGWRLSELNISLCSDMRSHRIRMIFSESGAGKSVSAKSSGPKEVAVLDSVQEVAVFDWWHQRYPLSVI